MFIRSDMNKGYLGVLIWQVCILWTVKKETSIV